MARDGRLGQSQNRNEIADTEFPVTDQMQNSQAHRIRERPEHQIDTGLRGRGHESEADSDIRLGGLEQTA